MREPELVLKAQQAAAALERAWERWRGVHGMTADPMPAISSYVGYSLEEPWGQPRVVFGISAEDAEQLVALLDRHDCVGPVHQTIASGQGGRELPSGASGPADQMVSVPRQAPSQAADSLAAVSQAAEHGRGPRLAHDAVDGLEQDGPVFRELMAAARKTSGTRMAAQAGAEPGAGDAGSAVGVLDADTDRAEAVAADSGAGDDRPTGAENGAVAGLDSQVAIHVDGETPSPSPDRGAADAEPAAQAEAGDSGVIAMEAWPAATAETAQEREIAAGGETDDPPGELADGPGPLAQAASTARVEAEARIRAAAGQANVAEPSVSEDSAVADPQDGNQGASATVETAASEIATHEAASNGAASAEAATDEAATDEAATEEAATDEAATEEAATDQTKPATTPVSAPPRTAGPVGKRGSAKKPPAEAGAEAPPVALPGSADERVEAGGEAADRDHPHDIASSLGRPESEVDEVSGPTIGAFGFGSDLVGSVGSYSEPGKRSDQSQDHVSSGYPRRGRSTRSYSIPRLSKSRRAGVSPGA